MVHLLLMMGVLFLLLLKVHLGHMQLSVSLSNVFFQLQYALILVFQVIT